MVSAERPEMSVILVSGIPSDVNPVNLLSHGVLPVSVLGSEEFDANQIDPASLFLAGAGPRQRGKSGNVASFEDINGDSFLDLVLHFDMDDLTIGQEAEELILTGLLLDGSEFEGADAIRIVPRSQADGEASTIAEADDYSSVLAGQDYVVMVVPEPAMVSILLFGLPGLLWHRTKKA